METSDRKRKTLPLEESIVDSTEEDTDEEDLNDSFSESDDTSSEAEEIDICDADHAS